MAGPTEEDIETATPLLSPPKVDDEAEEDGYAVSHETEAEYSSAKEGVVGGMPAGTIDDAEAQGSGTGLFPYLVIGSQLLIFIFYAVGTKQDFNTDDLTAEFDVVQMYNYLIGTPPPSPPPTPPHHPHRQT